MSQNKRIFSRVSHRRTLTPPPPTILANVQDRGKTSMNSNAPRLCRNSSPHPVHQIHIPCCRQTDTLREHALLETSNAMQTLPDVHERDL